MKTILLTILTSLIFMACDSVVEPKKDLYLGEGIRKFLTIESFNVQSSMIVDSNYRINLKLTSDFEIAGHIYFYENEDIVLSVADGEKISSNTDQHNKVDYKLGFHTKTNDNVYEIVTYVKVNNSFNNDYNIGNFFSLRLVIDSIYINKDTLFRTSLGAEMFEYPFITENRWYVKGQEMFDSLKLGKTTDFEYLSQYFGKELQGDIYFYPDNLYNGTIRIKRRK